MKDFLAKAKDLLGKVKELLAKGVAWFRGMDRTKKILVISSAAVVAVAIVVVCVVASLPGADRPTVPPTTGQVSTQTTYQVSVKDASGKPYTAGVIVRFMQNGKQVAMQPVNGNGLAEKTLPNGTYTVELEFTNAANAASYDEKNAVVSVDQPRLELVLMNTISGETTALFATSPVTGEGRDYLAYNVSTGDTSVPLEKGERSFFLFAPTEAGTYRFTTSHSNAVIGYYGAPHFVQPANVAQIKDNAFEVSVAQDMIGTNGTGTTVLVIGIDSVEDLAACVLTIERVGDPAWDISREPWTEYKNVFTPVPFVVGEDASIQEFDLTASTDTYNLVFNEADGCYHLDSEDGPLVLIRLAEKSAYMESYMKMLETSGINAYFFDEDGNFVKKEDYSANILAYLECVDEATGLYPLTEDLKYILQSNGEHMGWWNEDGYYLFLDDEGNKVPGINNEIAWLFMCCYDENNAGTFVEDSTQPETTVPETTVPETTVPETTVPPTTIPPAVTTPVETQPAVTRPTTPVVTQPAETKPAATRPVATRPAATRPQETVPPTTVPPTTAAPTTVPPTTAAPTTVPPTTAAPTTVPPTTAAPTTVPPTTAAPTEPTDVPGELVTLEDAYLAGFLEYDLEPMAPGTKVLYSIRLDSAYIIIADPDVCVMFDGKVYYPENGVVTVYLTMESPHAPAQVLIGNVGTTEKQFHIDVFYAPGTEMNPFDLPMGQITTELEEGNGKGKFFLGTVTQAGTLTIDLKSITDGVECDIVVDVIDPETFAVVQHRLSENDGVTTMRVSVAEGNQIKINICVKPTPKGKYRAATIVTELTIE